jgi:hypothetical protein
MQHRSMTKQTQITLLNLVGKIGQPSSFGGNFPPIRREKGLTIPLSHHQDFRRKARKYSGISEPAQG